MLLDLIKVSEETYDTRQSYYTSTFQPEYQPENTTHFRYLSWTTGETFGLKIYYKHFYRESVWSKVISLQKLWLEKLL